MVCDRCNNSWRGFRDTEGRKICVNNKKVFGRSSQLSHVHLTDPRER